MGQLMDINVQIQLAERKIIVAATLLVWGTLIVFNSGTLIFS